MGPRESSKQKNRGRKSRDNVPLSDSPSGDWEKGEQAYLKGTVFTLGSTWVSLAKNNWDKGSGG